MESEFAIQLTYPTFQLSNGPTLSSYGATAPGSPPGNSNTYTSTATFGPPTGTLQFPSAAPSLTVATAVDLNTGTPYLLSTVVGNTTATSVPVTTTVVTNPPGSSSTIPPTLSITIVLIYKSEFFPTDDVEA